MAEVKRMRIDQAVSTPESEFLQLVESEARWLNMRRLAEKPGDPPADQQDILMEAETDYLANARCAAGAYRRRFGDLALPNLPLRNLNQVKAYCEALRTACQVLQQHGQQAVVLGNALGLARHTLRTVSASAVGEERGPRTVAEAAAMQPVETEAVLEQWGSLIEACQRQVADGLSSE